MIRPQRGSAAVELVFLTGLWVTLVSGFLICCRLGLTQQRAHSAARMGAMLFSCGLVERSIAEAEIQRLLIQFKQRNSVDWSFSSGRFTGSAASRFYRLVGTEVQARFSFSPLVVREKVVLQEASEL